MMAAEPSPTGSPNQPGRDDLGIELNVVFDSGEEYGVDIGDGVHG